MSSGEEDNRHASSKRGTKRRKLVACDMCRRRKIKCDERLLDTGKCSNCTEFGWTCTYAQAPTKPFAPGYVEALEIKVKKLEALIKRVLPGCDFTSEVGFELTKSNWMEPGVLGASGTSERVEAPSAFVPMPSSDTPVPAGSSRALVNVPQAQPSEDYASSDDEAGDLLTKLQNLSLSGPTIIRSWGFSNYLGRSSTVGIVLVASKMLRQLHGPPEQSYFRMESLPKWLSQYIYDQESATMYQFPEPDLQAQLVDLYFRRFNVFTPILHRPTFEGELSARTHLRNRAFGGVTLLVCALGALVSDDRRVNIPDDNDNWQSAGWFWFRQVQVMDRSFVGGEKLYGLQIAALATSFMSRSFSPVHAWMFAGFGLRLAQNVGAHKRRAYGEAVTPQDEQYRRVTWVLIKLDLVLSKGIGRPCNIQEDEFDLELPQCCDDQYWTHEDPRQCFKQPEDKPSYMCYFISTIKLSQIMHLALRTIYASAKTRSRSGFTGEEWLLKTISHLDSLLNEWTNSVPEHLRDPSRVDGLDLLQSTALWLFYHEMRIVIHRPFIAPFDDKSKPFPAFTTCINASRSLVSLMSALEEKQPAQMVIMPAEAICNAATLSLIAIAAHKLNQMPLDVEHAQRDITACLGILQKKAHRWRWGAHFLNILKPLMAIFDTPNKLEALAGIPWSPQGAPSWHPTATGIEEHAERIASLRDPDSTGTEHGHTTLSSLDSISGLDWNLDWSVLGNFPGSSEYNNMNSLDPFAALDAMDGNIDDTILAQLSGLDANPSGEMSLAPEISSVREPTAFPPWNEPNSSFVEPWPVPRESSSDWLYSGGHT